MYLSVYLGEFFFVCVVFLSSALTLWVNQLWCKWCTMLVLLCIHVGSLGSDSGAYIDVSYAVLVILMSSVYVTHEVAVYDVALHIQSR